MLYARGSRFRSCISLTWRAARGRRQQVKSSAMAVTRTGGLEDLKITESMWNLSNQPNQLNQSIIESKLWTNVRCHRRSLKGRCLLRFAGRFGFQKRWSEMGVLKVRRSTSHFLPWEMSSMHLRRRAREARYWSGRHHEFQTETEWKTTPETIFVAEVDTCPTETPNWHAYCRIHWEETPTLSPGQH